MRRNGVDCLLMGGQACVLYGAAEFSRDTDLVVLAESANLERLERTLEGLQARVIAVPPFERRYLDMGLAVHFRCKRPDVEGMRIDVMSVLRGVDPFPVLWDRRTTVELEDDVLEVLSLPDLVRAKKTQRDKDWPMIARLVEVSFFGHQDAPSPDQVEFWLRELRTAELLVEVASRFPDACRRLAADRPLLALAAPGREDELRPALRAEEEEEREADRRYWRPLKEELARLRRERRGS